MTDARSPSIYPWRLTASIDTTEEVSYYRTRAEATQWAVQFIKKHYTVTLHKFERGAYHERQIPQRIIDEARQKAY